MLSNDDISKEIKRLEEDTSATKYQIQKLQYKIDDLEIMRRDRRDATEHLSQSIRSYIDNIIEYEKSIEINNQKIFDLKKLFKENETLDK